MAKKPLRKLRISVVNFGDESHWSLASENLVKKSIRKLRVSGVNFGNWSHLSLANENLANSLKGN